MAKDVFTRHLRDYRVATIGADQDKQDMLDAIIAYKEANGVRVTAGGYPADSPEYRALHRHCPECGSTRWGTTLLALHGTVDNNRARCECGWVGRVHDLVDRPPSLIPENQ